MIADHVISGTGLGRFSPEARRLALIRDAGVDVLLDVGANEGQYAQRMRAAGFTGRVVSFEPVTEAFERLEAKCGLDPAWTCEQLALADLDGEVAVNVSGSTQSSSLLPLGRRHVEVVPRSPYVGTEVVGAATLDTLWPSMVAVGEVAYLKLDVQGSELKVLQGAGAALQHVALVEAELSLAHLYDGGPLYREVVDHLARGGFRLVSLEEGLEEIATGEMLQFDGIFTRRPAG